MVTGFGGDQPSVGARETRAEQPRARPAPNGAEERGRIQQDLSVLLEQQALASGKDGSDVVLDAVRYRLGDSDEIGPELSE